MRSTAPVGDFAPVIATFQSKLSEVNESDFSEILWISGGIMEDSCGTELTSFKSGASDDNYLSVEHNLGDYLLSDFWHLSRLGKNIYIYTLSEACWRTFQNER